MSTYINGKKIPDSVGDDVQYKFGSSNDARLVWDTSDANANMFKFGLPAGGAVNVPIFAIGISSAGIGVDLGLGNGATDPILFISDTDADNGLLLMHDGTDAHIDTIGGDIIFNAGGVELLSESAGAIGAQLVLYQNSASPGQGDQVGGITFRGEDSASNAQDYAQIYGVIGDPTSTTELGAIGVEVANPGATGALTQAFSIFHDGTNGAIDVGDDAAAGVVSSNGEWDLILRTGNDTTSDLTITDGPGGGFTFTQAIGTSGTPTALTITGAAHTGLTAATEVIGTSFDFSASKTWAAGAGPLATQREIRFQAPTYIGNAGGALTITAAATVYIDAAPTAGANMTLTNSYALWVDDGDSRFDGAVSLGGSFIISS
jgi:hypothetical protein